MVSDIEKVVEILSRKWVTPFTEIRSIGYRGGTIVLCHDKPIPKDKLNKITNEAQPFKIKTVKTT